MSYKSVCLALNFGDVNVDPGEPSPEREDRAAEDYAVAFCAREQAHLSVLIGAPTFRLPSAGFSLFSDPLDDDINAGRRKLAEEAEERIGKSAALGGVTAAFQTVQQSYEETNSRLAAAARPSDLIIVPRASDGVSLDQTLIEAMLFASGRPAIVVPPDWERGPELGNMIVAWDGSARAARAVGDAMPLLERAAQVEILCAAPDAAKSVAGADLAAHLARHCKRTIVTELQTEHGDVGKTLRAHAATARPSLFVMGAYTHPHLLQMMLGGVTSHMLAEAEFPLFLSY
jgi:nucleotide-binding universal stress UspA family protein